MSRRTLFLLLLLALALRFVPRPAEQALFCRWAPSPAMCDVLAVGLVRLLR